MKRKKLTTDNFLIDKELANESESQSTLDRRTFMKQSLAASAGVVAASGMLPPVTQETSVKPSIKITDMKCAVIANSAVVRITTDQGIEGYGQAETSKPYLKPFVMFYRDYLIGEDPTNVQRILLKIRRMGSFKPWGSAVSAIEIALWDIAGKAANVPVYKLLGGKIRDKVRCYNGGIPFPRKGTTLQDFKDWGASIRDSEYGFSFVKQGLAFHGGGMLTAEPNLFLGNTKPSVSPNNVPHPYRGPLTPKGIKYMVEHVAKMKEGLGDDIGLALDCGPGFMLSDAIRLAKALEPFNLMWMEDVLTGDYTPYVMAADYRELTISTSTPIHTGEQLYLRENCRELIDNHSVRILGPDPEDIGGIAELKWIAEYADIHGIQMAPHGVFDGVFGLAAHVHVGAAMPENFIAFEFPRANPAWWLEIVEGLPNPIIKESQVEVWDRPGLGVVFNKKAARQYLSDEDKKFLD